MELACAPLSPPPPPHATIAAATVAHHAPNPIHCSFFADRIRLSFDVAEGRMLRLPMRHGVNKRHSQPFPFTCGNTNASKTAKKKTGREGPPHLPD
jgi:hypothetical protein